MPILLPTDLLFFLMLAGMLLLAVRSRGQEHLRRPWRKVARSRSAMISLVILLAYLLLAVLDSIRLPAGARGLGEAAAIGEPLTLLDLVLTPDRKSVV